MNSVLLNPLSPSGQCATTEAAEAVLADLVDTISYLLPAIQAGRLSIYLDDRMEMRQLVTGEVFLKTLNGLNGRRARDLKKKWFLYTNRRLRKCDLPHVEVHMSSPSDPGNPPVQGEVVGRILHPLICLLSFGGCALMEGSSIQASVSSGTPSTREIPNAHRADAIRILFPVYKASSKHRKDRYYDAERAEWVAPMSLPEEIAQATLLSAVHHEGDYFGLHAQSAKYIRFKNTLNNEYHGFEVEPAEIPEPVKRELEMRVKTGV